MYQVYDLQKNEFREEQSYNKQSLAEEFRSYWSEINYDSEYEDIINSDLGEDASKEEVDKVMNERIYGVSAEKYLRSCGFEIREVN